MIDTVINTKDAKKADIVILSAPYEGGVSFMGGTAKAPQKILKILNENLELFDTDLLCEPAKKIKTAHREISGLKKLIPEKVFLGRFFPWGAVFIFLAGSQGNIRP